MEENRNEVVEEVKPVEVAPVEVQTVDVDQVVGQPTESNNSNNDNQNKRRSPRELVLIVIAALTMIASGLYYSFFYDDDEGSDSSDQEIVEKQDNKKETTNDDTTTKEEDKKESTDTTVSKVTYYISEFNSEKYDFSVKKNLVTSDTITLNDISKDGKEITYTFAIENKKVVVSNSYDSKYTIDKITNAKQLLVAEMGQAPEYAGAFVVTEDNKLYSIGLFNSSKSSQVITDCKELENMVKEETSNVKTISSGALVEKNTTGGEGIVLIEKNDNQKYALSTRNITE